MENLIKYAKEIGIDLITYKNIENFNKKDLILKRNNEFFVKYDENVNFLDDKNTVISIAIAYKKQKNLNNFEYYGDISMTSYGIDYHKVLTKKMNLLIEYLNQENETSIGMVDIGSIDNRYAAYITNMGIYGKNTMIITKEFGSLIYLGTILTTKKSKSDFIKLKNPCHSCNLCEIACPTNVLKDYKINPKYCLSYLTQIEDVEEKYFEKFNLLYGCDICQNVCPENKNQNYLNNDLKQLGIEKIDLEEFLKLSNKSYKKKYGDLAFSWRKYKIIKRNVYLRLSKYNNLDLLKKEEIDVYLNKARLYSINKIKEKNK